MPDRLDILLGELLVVDVDGGQAQGLPHPLQHLSRQPQLLGGLTHGGPCAAPAQRPLEREQHEPPLRHRGLQVLDLDPVGV